MGERTSRPRKLRDHIVSLGFFVPNALVAAVTAAILTEAISQLNLTLPGDVNTTVVLPLKAGLAGVLAAALLAFWGFFWAEVLAPSTTSVGLPSLVSTYRPWFAWLAPTLLLLFVSIGADFYLVLVNKKSLGAAEISFGTFGAAMLMIALFVLHFIFRLSYDMKNLFDAGQIPGGNAKDTQHHETGEEKREAVRAAFSAAGYSGSLAVAANTTIDERIFVLPSAAFNQISKWADLTLVLQQLLGTKVSIVQESKSMPALKQFE